MTFLFFSDTQANPETGDYSALTELISFAVMQSGTPELVIFGGDTVNNGRNESEWADFWRAASAPLDGLITAAVPGNHDNHALLSEQFSYPVNAPVRQNEGFFYSFDIKQIHFIMLDSNIMGAANPEDIKWLEHDLQSGAARSAAWRVAVMHHPMWPAAANAKDVRRAETMREHFLPILEAYGVEFILCGHQHLYTRSLPMSGGFAGENGIIQIMAASGGKDSYTFGNFEHIACTAPAPNFLLLSADDRTFSVTAYGGNGKLLDSYTFTR